MAKIITEPPPILPDIEEQLKEYIICPEKLPIHNYKRNQEFWNREPDPTDLFYYEGSPLATTLKVQRDPNTGEIIDFIEIPVQAAGATAKNSMSLTRAPGLPSETVKGNASYMPFWPGGFPDPILEISEKIEFTDTELLTIAPGLRRGLEFESDGFTLKFDNTDKADLKHNNFLSNTKQFVNLMDLVQEEDDLLGIWKSPEAGQKIETENKFEAKDLIEEEGVLPKDMPVLRISEDIHDDSNSLKGTEWAVLLDSTKPVTDFHERIPEMAQEYPFELDTFQKLAILQLEQHNHVFVAAHTSAGKTVVAEYAIALSQKHMTRCIYTSPIKALSNQKYRDFKQIFKDVGLITGDFQINQTAACLIMTTEILRSMLYCGSDATRDLEYVIFDEVHYINDKERGHVWEQVLILLPSHVCVVLLSATVPNTIEFADWLGRTYQKKVYVVSTYQRPVPLQHYLYTGVGGSTKDNRYMVLNSKGWNVEAYSKAVESNSATANNKFITKFNLSQEKTLWHALISHLQSKELLPVVAFTFSRVKCDNNAQNLLALDLTSQTEKFHIQRFFDECVKSLKEPDRNIPQIVRMKEILQKGIGVHHSGVLPIIKEMVEMLFQNGLVKLLFATETFAMGVNMPARTVVFDSICKHDGRQLRNLSPAEYIQMAGRAGRRGKDKRGTVIILCKKKIPSSKELHDMMLGKPSQLKSKFRLTYGMVLSLLRVESLSVECMMSRSFREADHQKNMDTTREKLKVVKKALKENYTSELSSYLQPLIEFYGKVSRYLEIRQEVLPEIMASSKALKELSPGKLILITHDDHMNKLALVLSTITRANNIIYKVLVLTEKSVNNTEKKTDLWYKMVALSKEEIYSPITTPCHEVLSISPLDIFEICAKKVKIEAELVMKDWEKRQIPRFSADPPGPSCASAVQELLKITMSVKNENKLDAKLQYLDFIQDLKINEQGFYENITYLNNLKEQVYEQLSSVKIPNFEEQFVFVFEKKILEDKRDALEHSLSHASMALYPDYENRIQLLRDLKYVDSQNRVELKGQVACEMGMNELMITELVLRNVLTKLQPAEVAALLSSMVFQAKTNVEISSSDLTNELKNSMKEIVNIFNEIQNLEEHYRICHDIGRDEELNFGLVQVVYEWASAKPFAEIMDLTDVQEGIIVRCIQQLNETICAVKNAARLIGDPELQSKMEEASAAIKRDIVFAASLYTQREAAVL